MQLEKPQTVEVLYNNKRRTVCLLDNREGEPIVYLHGWGTNWFTFQSLIDSLLQMGRHIAIDLPGFGDSPHPGETWGTEDYADFVHALLKERGVDHCVLIGHSFGGRIAIQLAHRWPDFVKGLVLIASAGLKRKIPFAKRIKIKTIRFLAKSAHKWIPGAWGKRMKERLYDKIASRDYKEAGEMRPIFVKVVNENLKSQLSEIQAPTLLIWGAEDTETPPAIGKQMRELIPDNKYIELPGFDHYTILSRAKHQVGFQIRQFLKGLVE